ncbi:MAG: glucose 1-dehydrogenase [Candidatus Dadabacteria bacterium]|nr:MAG: glucose 1-dehydrogenase [Candidatus Dadabacteria bacterium]
MNLEGKAALVTGSAVGVGRAVVLDLARRGCNVVVNYSRSRQEAEQTAAEAERLGVRALCLQADVRRDDQVRRMAQEAVKAFGGLDVLVNNAGVTRFIPHADLEAVSDEDWDYIFDTNVRGTFYATRAALPALREGTGGAIVNLSSVAGVYSIGSSVPYCASKAAIGSMTVALARALAPKVRVNAVAPGFVDTRWWQEHPNYEAAKQAAEAATPLGRVCTAADVSKVVLDLITSEMITGQVVVVDGGMGIARGL